MLDEYTDNTHTQKIGQELGKDVDLGAVNLKSVTARWNPDIPEPTLNNVSVQVNPHTLTAIVGPVGCGKVSSSLFCVLSFVLRHIRSFLTLVTNYPK